MPIPLRDVLDFLTKDWPIILKNPVPFVEAVFLVIVLCLWIYRIRTKDIRDALDRYRKPKSQTFYDTLSDRELKNNALRLLGDFRLFVEGATQRQAELLRDGYGSGPIHESFISHTIAQYDREFKAKILNYRDEVRFRVRGSWDDFNFYDDPQSPRGLQIAANNFDRLVHKIVVPRSIWRTILRFPRPDP